MAASVSALRTAFRRLHESGCFVIPNPWNRGTARYLAHLGFRALATTSSGFAFSRGAPDSPAAVPRDAVLAHFAELVQSVDLPVNADFATGYADDPEGVAGNVRLCVETGVAGLSIEDATGDPNRPLYELNLSVERVKAARDAIARSGSGVLLTARAECFLVNHPDPLNESIRRLTAYADAGADVLYAPGLRTAAEITQVVQAVHPKPLNVLMSANTGMTVGDLAALGVRRISVGSALARVAWTAFMRVAQSIATEGSFASFRELVQVAELNRLFEASDRSPE